jgi:putative SOS response-associated peptidase YedK
MCGRFVLVSSGAKLAEVFGLAEEPRVAPRYNIAPSQPVAVVRAARHDGGAREWDHLRWGLVPSWMKEVPTDAPLINARAETAMDKPAFRAAFRRRRCLIPADGFYEWQTRDGGGKQPWYVTLETGEPFAFAGLWEHWQGADGSELESCALLTTEPNALMRPIHRRMPVILRPRDHDLWLDPREQDPDHLRPLLAPYAGNDMIAHPVSRHVNNPRHDDERCIAPAAADDADLRL